VTGSEDRQARIFDAATGDELAHFEAGSPVKDATFDGDGRRVVILRKDRAIVWDRADTHGTVTLRSSRRDFVRTPCFTPDGTRVVTTTHEGVSVWTRKGEFKLRIAVPGDAVTGADVDPKSERVVLGTQNGTVAIYSLVDGQRILQFEGHKGRVNAIAFGAHGDRVVTASTDRTAVVWNASDCRKEFVVERPGEIVWAALRPDGRLLATVEKQAQSEKPERAEQAARLWHVGPSGSAGQGNRADPNGSGGAGTSVEHDQPVTCCVFRPDGNALLTTSMDRTARVTVLAADPSGKLTGTLAQTLRSDRPLLRAAFSTDGHRALICGSSADHVACLFDVATSEPLLVYRGHLGQIEGCCFSPGGDLAVTASRDGTAQIWPTDPVAVADRLTTLRKLTAEERNSFSLPPESPEDR
jgi:WD40 repeat protein